MTEDFDLDQGLTSLTSKGILVIIGVYWFWLFGNDQWWSSCWWSEQRGLISSSRQLQVSYPHYTDRVYDTKADPLSDGNPGSCCYVIALLCLHPGS